MDGIASRVARIVSGSAHALLDAVEGAAPEAVMAQAIREVEQVGGEVRAELGKAAANKHLAASRLGDLNARHTDLAANSLHNHHRQSNCSALRNRHASRLR